MRHQQGSTLLVVMMLMVLLGGFTIALQSMTWHQHRAAQGALSLQIAQRAAESGVAFFLGECRADPDYFTANPAPHAARTIGSATFTLEGAEAQGDDWDLLIIGTSNGVETPLAATIGFRQVMIPPRLHLSGSGNAGDTALQLQNSSLIGSYDSTIAAFDKNDPSDAIVHIDGSLTIENTATTNGDVVATGTLLSGSASSVTGTLTENSTVDAPEDIDPLIVAKLADSKASNDNGNLASIFGASWTPIADSENYGDLIVSSGSYVVPSGTYRFRKLEVRGTATVIFDTSSAPSTLVYVGAGVGTGTGNDLILDKSSKIQIDAGGSVHGLLTVLASDCDLKMSNGSEFGQEVNDTASGGYHQIVSLGGNGSSDVISLDQSSKMYGRLHATAHVLNLDNQSGWYGSAVALSAQFSNSAFFAVDSDALGNRLSVPGELTVLATWPIADIAP